MSNYLYEDAQGNKITTEQLIEGFISEYYIKDPSGFTPSDEIEASFRSWSKQVPGKYIEPTTFKHVMRSMGYPSKRIGARWFRYGLKAKNPSKSETCTKIPWDKTFTFGKEGR